MTPLALAPLLLALHGTAADTVIPNDNRVPAGVLRAGVRQVRLEARAGGWRPDLAVDSLVTVEAFAQAGGAPSIPGPLIRERTGTEVRISVRNSLSAVLVVHGLRAGTVTPDTLHVAPGAVREVRFRPTAPGTYLYWGSTTGDGIDMRYRRDSQLTGAIVIDPPAGPPDPAERIFVLTLIDLFPDDTLRNPAGHDSWELAINGRSWPHTERLEYGVGDTVRFRWLNGSDRSHPMHLHGFHFRVLARGDGYRDRVLPARPELLAVTEFLPAGSTFRMEWVPSRAGNWLMHCHMTPHITPYPARDAGARDHDVHDVARHPLDGMAGLVLGITTVDRDARVSDRGAEPVPVQRLRLFAQRAAADSGQLARSSFVLQQGDVPAADSVVVPGSTLLLTRGQTTAITVLNRLPEPTTVHWHGMELSSVYDGVAGWSRTGSSIAPLLAPGDSFTVVMTPPRAGTYIYHTHMDEGMQLPAGMYGALLVLEPGSRYDPETDRLFVIGLVPDGPRPARSLNGSREPAPLTLQRGIRYRLRFISILPAAPLTLALTVDGVPLEWTAISKDGAELAPALRITGPARIARMGVGETYDFEWTPDRPMDALLEVRIEDTVLRQILRIQ